MSSGLSFNPTAPWNGVKTHIEELRRVRGELVEHGLFLRSYRQIAKTVYTLFARTASIFVYSNEPDAPGALDNSLESNDNYRLRNHGLLVSSQAV